MAWTRHLIPEFVPVRPQLFILNHLKNFLNGFVALACAAFLVSCASSGGGAGYGSLSPEEGKRLEAERAAKIQAEPRGDFYIGRRYYVRRIHAWGYLRRPGQSWSSAKVVMMNESSMRVPDRLPEFGTGKVFGFDHNYEYKIRGNYTGRTIYDPNANARLPEFRPTSIEILDKSPGFLFKPGQRYNPGLMPRGLEIEPR